MHAYERHLAEHEYGDHGYSTLGGEHDRVSHDMLKQKSLAPRTKGDEGQKDIAKVGVKSNVEHQMPLDDHYYRPAGVQGHLQHAFDH